MDEDKLRKLINFVKPFELPEIKPPPARVIKEEPDEIVELKTRERLAKEEVREDETKPAEEENPVSKIDKQIPISTKESSTLDLRSNHVRISWIELTVT